MKNVYWQQKTFVDKYEELPEDWLSCELTGGQTKLVVVPTKKRAQVELCEGFKELVLPFLEKDKKSDKVTCTYFDNPEPMTDDEVLSKLSSENVFNLNDFWVLEELVKKQPNGVVFNKLTREDEDGDLFSQNWASNYFPMQVGVRVLLVDVSWWFGGWHFQAWELGDLDYHVSKSRFFSKTT
jgi:hypothetical protein